MTKRTQNKASEFTLPKEQIEKLFLAAGSIRDRTLLKVLYHCALRRGGDGQRERGPFQ